MGEYVISTLINIFLEAQVMAVQETASIEFYPSLNQSLHSNNLSFVPRYSKHCVLIEVYNGHYIQYVLIAQENHRAWDSSSEGIK